MAIHRGLAGAGLVAAAAAAILWLLSGQAEAVTGLVPLTATYVVGLVAFQQRPGNLAARRLLALGTAGVTMVALAGALSLATAAGRSPSWAWLATTAIWEIELLWLAAWLAFLVVFPDGHYQAGWERALVRAAVTAAAVLPVVRLVLVARDIPDWVLPAPSAVASPLYLSALQGLSGPFQALWRLHLLVAVAGVALLAVHARRFDRTRRRQVMWPLLAVILLAAFLVEALIAGLAGAGAIPGLLPDVMFTVVLTAFPVAIGIGMLRYQLMDVGRLVRGSLVYGLLWTLIAILYIVLSTVFGLAVAQRLPLSAAIIATLVATVLFQPARKALERVADRVVYGARLEGLELIRALGTQLEETGDQADLARHVTETVRAALDARWVRIVLTGPEGALTAAEAGQVSGAGDLCVPLRSRDADVGRIECGPKREGEYRDSERELLLTLGRQAALAIRNSSLTEQLSQRVLELAASRARIVHAEEMERRRIERDIHDGVQQHIVALMTRLGLASSRAARGEPVHGDLSDLRTGTEHLMEELRELVHGIHPAVLSDNGLVDAITARVSRLPLRVRVQADPDLRDARLPAEVEGAAYFFVCEGLTNVLKHSGSGEAVVGLHRRDRQLHLVVADGGGGFDPGRRDLSGVRGLADRIEALGGRVEVVSAPGAGTELRAWVPIEGQETGWTGRFGS
jgi:signal transduction histidine kinase